MASSIINKYIAYEVLIPTILGNFIFVFIMMLGQIPKLANLVINKGVPITKIIIIFGYFLPTLLVMTIPLSFMLGVILAFSKLSSDNEIIALKASGISHAQMINPVIVLAIFFSTITAFVTTIVVPECKHQFLNKIFDIAVDQASLQLKPKTFNDDFKGFVIYANAVDDRTGTLKGIFISDERSETIPMVVLAKSGRIFPERDTGRVILRLNEGTIQRRPKSKPGDIYQLENFSTFDINLNLDQSFAGEGMRHWKPAELSTGKLISMLHSKSPDQLSPRYFVEFHQRLIFPLSPLIFALIGVPLAIQSNRSGRGSSFGLALGVFLLYYMTMSVAQTLVEKLNTPAGLTMWSPTILFLAGALFLNVVTAKEIKILSASSFNMFRIHKLFARF